MQNSRRWIVRVILGVLAALALVGIAIIVLEGRGEPAKTTNQALMPVVVALGPVEAGHVLTTENVGVETRDSGSVPSGAVTRLQDAMGQILNRDLSTGDLLFVTDLSSFAASEQSTGTKVLDPVLGNEWVAVALKAPDLWSQWGAIQPGDHIDLLATIDVALDPEQAPLLPAFVPTESISMPVESQEQVMLWTIQGLKVLQVTEEPMPEALFEETDSPIPFVPSRRLLLIVKATPQDAAILHFLEHADATLDLALRSSQNSRQFDVDAVTLDYLLGRYSPSLKRTLP